MPDICVRVLQLRDCPFEIGFKTGEKMRNQPIVKTFESITKPEIDTET